MSIPSRVCEAIKNGSIRRRVLTSTSNNDTSSGSGSGGDVDVVVHKNKKNVTVNDDVLCTIICSQAFHDY